MGANLARRLVRDGHEVHLLVRPEHAGWRLDGLRDDVQLEIADLRDAGAVKTRVRQVRPDWVFHLAAHGAYSSQTDLQRIFETNILGTAHFVEACLETGFEAFVNAGSSSEYGFKNHPPPETEWLEPNSHYAVAKASATQFCRYVAQSRGVHLTTLRLYSVFGPYEEPGRLLPTLILAGLQGHLPPLVHPDIGRDFVHVDDVVDACLLVADRPPSELGAVYNVGTGIQTTLRQAVSVARQVMDIRVEPEWGSMQNRHWDTGVWVAAPDKIQDALGWRPRYEFERGLRELVDWFRANPALQRYYETMSSP